LVRRRECGNMWWRGGEKGEEMVESEMGVGEVMSWL